MATASSMPPILSLKRSAQSGSKVMTSGWQTVYTNNSNISLTSYLFCGANINLTPMALGDTIDIRIRKIIVPGGAYVNHDQVRFIGVQPASHPSFSIGPIPDVYGVEISMEQPAVAVALLTLETEFFDAKRLGEG